MLADELSNEELSRSAGVGSASVGGAGRAQEWMESRFEELRVNENK